MFRRGGFWGRISTRGFPGEHEETWSSEPWTEREGWPDETLRFGRQAVAGMARGCRDATGIAVWPCLFGTADLLLIVQDTGEHDGRCSTTMVIFGKFFERSNSGYLSYMSYARLALLIE